MFWLRIATIVFLMSITSGAALAENAGAMMREFGLVGTWSIDCSVDMRSDLCKHSSVLWSVESSLRHILGMLQRRWITPPHSGLKSNTKTIQISSAERITNEKIKLTYTVTSARNVSGKSVYVWPMDGEIWEVVYEKIGDKMRAWLSQRADGGKVLVRNGHPTVVGGNWNPEKPGPVMVWNEKPENVPLLERCTN